MEIISNAANGFIKLFQEGGLHLWDGLPESSRWLSA